MSAHAVLVTERAADARSSRLRVLRSQGPLVLRPTHAKGREPLVHGLRGVARVMLAAGAAGPLGGDDFALDVQVGVDSALVLNEVSAMLVLPGPTGERSRMHINVHVEAGATFVWMPEPVIAAHGCNHDHAVHVSLESGARMVMREETLLGRHREQPGRLSTTLRVTCDGAPLYHQQLRFGPDAAGWDSAAVAGDHQAIGSIIAVDPTWADGAPPACALHRDAIVSPLAGPGVAVSAVAPNSLDLRRLLHRGLDALGPPWGETDTAGAPAPVGRDSEPINMSTIRAGRAG